MITTGVLIGLVTGVLSGLLGIGGSGVMVVLSVSLMGVAQHSAQAAAVAASIPIAVIGVINFHRKKLVNYQVALYLALGVGLGSLLGAYIANLLPGPILKKIFSIFFGLMSAHMFWTTHKKSGKEMDKSLSVEQTVALPTPDAGDAVKQRS
jgi:uncharacterized membrane protein YfcA